MNGTTLNGKILWSKLKVTEVKYNNIDKYGYIDIDIPVLLYPPHEKTSVIALLIRGVIYNKMVQLMWPVEGLNSLYYSYQTDIYKLQIMTSKKSTADFYFHLMDKK